MKIAELARRTGLTAHTIRYYERIGLMPRAGRDGAGHRDYGADALIWISFLGHMKAAGMPIQEMLHYARLRGQGSQTGPQRADILRQRRELVAAQITTLQATLSVLDDKIAGYDAEGINHADRNQT
ncbi:MerR family transcriptional regulator [Paracoccus sp. 11-3]|uniref:MerR family transcriptional regulator n=1 Tax=Paracoccus amoyensis TaxID=2760093 RepID=A0A926GG18_9RHOB|nr:MerR family transcriptional regulator [Paracoccus amoyensis]MBC9247936.1 MerR family transcriptional regulator [Paracoccus amoyensis]